MAKPKPRPAEQLRQILSRLRGVPAAGEHTLKTWGREIGQTLTQIEDLLGPEVAAGRVTREQRRDGTYLYRAVRLEAPVEEAVEEPAPAPVEEPAAVAAVVAAVEEVTAPEAPSPEDEFKPEPEPPAAPPPAPVTPLALLPADLSEDQLQALLAAKKRHARAVEALSAAQAELEAAQAAWMAALAGQALPPRGPAKAPATTDEAMPLGPSAAKIVSYLRNASGSADVDAILRGTGLERSSLSALLSTLTQRGAIRRVGRGLYQGVA